MAESIYDTVVAYIENCKAADASPNSFVLDVMQKLKDELAFEEVDTIDLKLCANNKLTNPRKIRIGDSDAQVLSKTLQANTMVVCLDLRYNCIADAGAEALAELLKSNKTLTLLNLMCNDIGERGAGAIATALRSNETLLELSLAGNKIGDAGGLRFAESLQVNETLEALDLGDCDLRIDAVIALATVLNNNETLRSLNVNRPLLWTQQEEQAVHMGDMLCRSRGLKELHLAKCHLHDFGAARLADGLLDNRHLTVLNISCNRITRDGAAVLAKLLQRNTPLQILDASHNRFECDGAKSIAAALFGANTNLRVLAMQFNEIKDAGLVAVAECLRYNSSLRRLFLWGNSFGQDACAAFGEVLRDARLAPQDTDLRHYEVDGQVQLAQTSHDLDYRLYRYTAPVYGDSVPTDKRFALS